MTFGRKIFIVALLLMPVLLVAGYSLTINQQGTGIYSLGILLAIGIALFVIREISKQKKTEKHLRKNEESAQLLIANIKDYAIFMIDKNGCVASWNAGAEYIKGYNEEEIIGKPIEIFYTVDDIKKGIPNRNLQMAKEKGHHQDEGWRLRKGGSKFWADVIFTALRDKDGGLTGFAKVTRDITEWKKNEEKLLFLNTELEQRVKARTNELASSEERFRTLIENITDAIVLNDKDSNIMYQSPSVTKILGYPPEERKGKKVLSYVHPESEKDFLLLYEKLEKYPGTTLPFQYRFLHKNGHYIWLEGVVTNLLHDPVIKSYVANYRDITERKEAEQKIKKINSELEERVFIRTEQLKKTNEELEAFSYSVSHDLRAPLRAIIGFTAILEEEYSSQLGQEAMRLTGVIKSNTEKMGMLIDDLLSFSRMGRHEIEKMMINTNEMVKQVITELEQKNNRAEIVWMIDSLQPAFADSNMLKQVWINLVSNAVKYSAGQSSPRIEIESCIQNNHAVFFIRDNGVGFDQKYSDKLFKVFQRLHSSNEFEGTGIGLAIVEKIISKHGGKVWAEAEVNKGASFYFSLPAKE